MNTTQTEIRITEATSETMQAAIALLNESEAFFTKIVNETHGEDAPQAIPGTFDKETLKRDAVVLAYIGDDLVGCVRIANWNTDSPVVCLDNLYVVPSARRRGVASSLVNETMACVKRAGRHLELGVLAENTVAMKFWEGYMKTKVSSWYWMF